MSGFIKAPTTGTRVSGFLVRGFKEFGGGAFGASKTVFRHNKFVNNGSYGVTAFFSSKTRFLQVIQDNDGSPTSFFNAGPYQQYQIAFTQELIRFGSTRGAEHAVQDFVFRALRDRGYAMERFEMDQAALARHPGAGAFSEIGPCGPGRCGCPGICGGAVRRASS